MSFSEESRFVFVDSFLLYFVLPGLKSESENAFNSSEYCETGLKATRLKVENVYVDNFANGFTLCIKA